MIIKIGNIPTVTVGKIGIKIKKSHQGLFSEYCGGKVTDECIQRGKIVVILQYEKEQYLLRIVESGSDIINTNVNELF